MFGAEAAAHLGNKVINDAVDRPAAFQKSLGQGVSRVLHIVVQIAVSKMAERRWSTARKLRFESTAGFVSKIGDTIDRHRDVLRDKTALCSQAFRDAIAQSPQTYPLGSTGCLNPVKD